MDARIVAAAIYGREIVSDYNDYLLKEWQLFIADGVRQESLLAATAALKVKRVLDIGCGAGQEMLPFVTRGAIGCGIDVAPETGKIGRQMFANANLADRISFQRASGEHLPFADNSFDLIICRVALMYMNARTALTEMRRVLEVKGLLLLKIHAPGYYYGKIKYGWRHQDLPQILHSARVLGGGVFFGLTGRQSFGRLTAGGEIFLTEKILRRETDKLKMKIVGQTLDTNPQAPSFIIEKQ